MPIKRLAVIRGGDSRGICKSLKQILSIGGLEGYLDVTESDVPHGEYSERILAICGEVKDLSDVESFDTVIYPYNECKPQSHHSLFISYDKDNDCADLTAKNIRESGGHFVFELLGTGMIVRLRIKKYGVRTVERALIQAAVLLRAGIPVKTAADVINAKNK